MYSGQIRLEDDIRDFQNSVRILSQNVNGAGLEWRDSKYAELRESINSIAADSKAVLQASERCLDALKKFETIRLGG